MTTGLFLLVEPFGEGQSVLLKREKERERERERQRERERRTEAQTCAHRIQLTLMFTVVPPGDCRTVGSGQGRAQSV